ncbi:predicted protein [Botrytis cinerea T4]|uniref:Uncharacterized protein n=1 Tax=Botryotinia fuckeliana (strain T4) TaxID=999810 RepID=G2YG77_BOTF4|nr:predicted protein [Botrytis cinerea T4]
MYGDVNLELHGDTEPTHDLGIGIFKELFVLPAISLPAAHHQKLIDSLSVYKSREKWKRLVSIKHPRTMVELLPVSFNYE